MRSWITVWSQSHTNIQTVTPKYQDRTLWLTVPVGLPGEKLRLRFSNKAGVTRLHILQAAVCLDGGRRQGITFGGSGELLLEVGQEGYCDEIPLSVRKGQQLSLFVAFRGKVTSGNCIAAHVQCSKAGNYVYAPQIDLSRRGFLDSYWGNLPGIPAIAAVEVFSAQRPDVIVCFGDSITQQSTWTVPLEQLLNQNGHPAIVLNGGIGGNRLLLGPPEPELQVFGPAAMERFARDVLEVPGATTVLLALGTNDIGWIRKPEELRSAGADAVFAGLRQLAEKAHGQNLRVFAATLPPRNGSLDYSPAQEAQRLRLNDLIRNAPCFDGVMDFAAAVADGSDPAILAPHCDSGDHLHPSPLGGQTLAHCAATAIEKR